MARAARASYRHGGPKAPARAQPGGSRPELSAYSDPRRGRPGGLSRGLPLPARGAARPCLSSLPTNSSAGSGSWQRDGRPVAAIARVSAASTPIDVGSTSTCVDPAEHTARRWRGSPRGRVPARPPAPRAWRGRSPFMGNRPHRGARERDASSTTSSEGSRTAGRAPRLMRVTSEADGPVTHRRRHPRRLLAGDNLRAESERWEVTASGCRRRGRQRPAATAAASGRARYSRGASRPSSSGGARAGGHDRYGVAGLLQAEGEGAGGSARAAREVRPAHEQDPRGTSAARLRAASQCRAQSVLSDTTRAGLACPGGRAVTPVAGPGAPGRGPAWRRRPWWKR